MKTESKVQKYDVTELSSKFSTKAAMIRFLDSEGLSRGEIAKVLGIRYQWVRNVLITPVKKAK